MNFIHFIKKLFPQRLLAVYHFILAWLSAVWYKFPSEKLIIIGVTGTTGKSTSVHLIAKTLENAGYKVGYTSTAMFKIADREWLNDKKMTMSGRFFTQSMLSRMVKAGCQYAVIETTSQGIEQFRHRFINYDILVFTGLYPEHIEAHRGLENYKAAKGKLFAHLKRCRQKYVNDKKQVQIIKHEIKKLDLERVKKIIIINGDDEHANYFLQFKAETKIVYKVESYKVYKVANHDTLTIKASNVDAKSDGTQFFIDGVRFKLQMLGAFNVYNALAAVSVGLTQGLNLEQIKNGLEKISGVPGRFEKITSPPTPLLSKERGEVIHVWPDFTVIVDYAFEPRAVEKLYETIKLMDHNKIIHVLGSAGGGRDIARRSILGKMAGERADFIVVTNEDPYDDDPQIIIDQVAVGAEQAGKVVNKNLFKIMDRREAIKKALSLAQAGDIVLITGKGCEQAICIAGGRKLLWDDRQVVREELNRITPSQ